MCANATGMRMRDNPKWIPTELDLFDGSSGELGRKSECFVLNYYHPKVFYTSFTVINHQTCPPKIILKYIELN